MLKSISLANFKSYREAKLYLAPMTFLIGANASGKSNALEAIRLLNWLAKGSRLDDIERAIQGGDTVVRGQGTDLFGDAADKLTIGAEFFGPSWAPYVELGCFEPGVVQNVVEPFNTSNWPSKDFQGQEYYFEISIGPFNDHLVVSDERISPPENRDAIPLYKIDGQPSPYSDEISVMYNNFSRGGVKPHIPCSNRQAIFYQLETPGRFEKKHQKSQELIPAVTKYLREMLRNIVFLDPRPAVMRDYSYAKDDILKEDGSNISAVLFRICHQGEQAKNQLLRFIRSLPEQDITDIQFIETGRRDVMVRLEETFGDQKRTVDAPLLSDGTLRVLAVAGVLLSAPTGALVIIEEIDNGVHPSRADLLVSQLQAVAKERGLRVLVTSHNPALLDALPDEALGDVMCCYRDPKEGDSRLVRLGDFDRFPELIAQGPLGQLMTRRVLDRFLKDDRTPEQRQQANLDWLRRFKESSEDEA